MKTIYLDNAATTPLHPQVLEAMNAAYETFGNASSAHGFGREAKSILEQSRATIARAIGAEPGELYFTSGGTESDNLAIKGVAVAAARKGKRHIVSSHAEHHAVLETCEFLEENGFDLTTLSVSNECVLDLAHLSDSLSPSTGLVSIMHANNEVGTISPLAAIAQLAHEKQIPVHTDAVQSLGKIPVNVQSLGVDLMSISAHKLYGPKGIGALFIKRGIEIDPQIHGGGQEKKKRPGTENVPLAVGFAKAVEIAISDMEAESIRLKRLRDTLESKLLGKFPEIIVNGKGSERLPHILNISFDRKNIVLEGEMLLMNMDLNGIAVSSGSACTSGSVQPSHVLLAMGRDEDTARATLRFSFGRNNSEEDITAVIQVLEETVSRMRST